MPRRFRAHCPSVSCAWGSDSLERGTAHFWECVVLEADAFHIHPYTSEHADTFVWARHNFGTHAVVKVCIRVVGMLCGDALPKP
eukprot:8135706-Alexandrium_andersonii.AAC.2